MGYRHYFYLVENNLINKIHNFSKEEFYEWGKSANLVEDYESEEDEWYLPLYKIGEAFFEFGKCYENYTGIMENGYALFKDQKLKDRYEEYVPYVVGQEAVLNAIEYQKSKIIEFYEEMLNTTEEQRKENYDERTNEQVFYCHIVSMYKQWKNPWGKCFALNLNLNSEEITESWMYEYSIFDLVRKYKTTDWNKYSLIFMGW